MKVLLSLSACAKEETAAEVYVISSMQGPSNLPDGSSIRRGNQIERTRLGRERDRDSEQEQTIWTKGNQGQEASGIDSSLPTWEQHRQFLEAGKMILQAGRPLSTPRNILFLLLLSRQSSLLGPFMLSIDIERSTSLTPDSGSFKCPVTFLSLSSPPAKPSEPVDPTLKSEKDHLKKIIQVSWS
ncbi:hypothetical protein FH972_027052 [Carpinus fangiana]|uniref:Uncharacterized protein n=1 Tax=Carpinus fangiana TaxID=176857 RepID=A0A5N6L5W1_9ROSI|nr:hypothetical protein FH972_027052 [Carpinus fangiana]